MDVSSWTLFLWFLFKITFLIKHIKIYIRFHLGNVLKELVEPNGAIIYAKAFKLGDPTISTLELWGAEYQESNALLVKEEHNELLRKICEREKVDVCFVGTITGKLNITLWQTF